VFLDDENNIHAILSRQQTVSEVLFAKCQIAINDIVHEDYFVEH
jgi:hypothetical protein